MQLPEVTEIRRWEVKPGDRLLVKVAGKLDSPQAHAIAEQVRARLQLAEDFPIVMFSEEFDVEVLRSGDPWRWFVQEIRKHGHALSHYTDRLRTRT